MNMILYKSRSIISVRVLWYWLFVVLICYNFHRYLFKYSHGAFAKSGYEQTPFIWQVGKYILVAIILTLMYSQGKFRYVLPIKLIIFYCFIFIVLVINIVSFFVYYQIMTDELEYLVFSLLLLPLGFMSKEFLIILYDELNLILNASQYTLIVSNWVVIFNYYFFGVVPFHAFKGILMRYGGLWDDPNTFAIVSVLFALYSLIKRKYLLLGIHIINVLLTISLNGYLLLLTLLMYWVFNGMRLKGARLALLILLIILLGVITFYGWDYFVQIYEAKKESIDQHSDLSNLRLYLVPLLQPLVFHETWLISLNINYFPFSIAFTLILLMTLFYFFFIAPKSLQRFLFILFFVTSLSLPFLYMFPVNFIALLFLVLYIRGVRF